MYVILDLKTYYSLKKKERWKEGYRRFLKLSDPPYPQKHLKIEQDARCHRNLYRRFSSYRNIRT